jgi:hypothetical protein
LDGLQAGLKHKLIPNSLLLYMRNPILSVGFL